MTNRKSISKSTRFEVFKRDKFTCQYCGKSAPEVVLHVDHIQPVSKDGDNEVTNLITACADCNLGKGARELSDDAVIQKRKAQLDELQDRREQLEMMLEWQRSLDSIERIELEGVLEYWEELMPGYTLNEIGIGDLKKQLRRYGCNKVMDAISKSCNQYLRNSKGEITEDTVNKTISMVPRIITVTDSPDRDLYYIRGIARNRCNYFSDWQAFELLKTARSYGASIDDLRDIAAQTRNWSSWSGEMREFTQFLKDQQEQENSNG